MILHTGVKKWFVNGEFIRAERPPKPAVNPPTYLPLPTMNPNATPAERIAALRTREFEKFAKAMRTYPTILRMQYGLALLQDKDAVRAETVRKQIDKVLASYPYPGEAEAERELLALLDAKAREAHEREETAI